MTTAIIEAGTLTASLADRIVSGLLLPFNEVGRTNLGKFAIPPGVINVPADASVMVLNSEHQRGAPLGHGLTLTATDAGIVASFRIGRTPEGDAYLADVEAGRRNALSAEVADVVIRAGKAIAGRLFAAAAVARGAFPSATLLAADVGEDPKTTEGTEPSAESPGGAESESEMDETETAPEVEQDDTEQETQPEPLLARLPGSVGGASTEKAGGSLYASLRGKTLAEAGTMMAALDQAIASDLLPTQQKQWLGEIHKSKTYVRRFASLVQHADLQALKAIGWKFTTDKTPVVAAYSGFPAQPNSNEVKTESVTLDAKRLAGAGSVDRAFLDFPSPEFWAGYFREQTNSYERVLDGIVRDALIAGATAVEGGTVPTGVSTAAAYIVDGAISILEEERDLPSFAIIGSGLYREFLLTRSEDMLAYLTAALGLEDGTLEGFKIVPSSVATLTDKVLVGTKTSATVFELPGSPVRVDTVNIAVGGAERGVFGYHAELINDATGLALVAEPVT